LKQKTINWLNIAQDDLEVAGQLFSSQKYLYCLFFCQQALEKIIKAVYYEKNDETPPRKHNLTSLAEDAGVLDELDNINSDLLDTLSQYYIESRYSEDRNSMARKCTKSFTHDILKQTGDVFKWLKSQLR
jgi:HEPN domain-containing protein